MLIGGIYSFNNGEKIIWEKYKNLIEEVVKVINSIDAERSKTKISMEKTMRGRYLYNPLLLNRDFKYEFLDYKLETFQTIL